MTETAAERKARLRALRGEAATADPRIAPPEPAPSTHSLRQPRADDDVIDPLRTALR